jgi:hypothetical protein
MFIPKLTKDLCKLCVHPIEVHFIGKGAADVSGLSPSLNVGGRLRRYRETQVEVGDTTFAADLRPFPTGR